MRGIHPGTLIFIVFLAITLVIWVLRGLEIVTLIPSSVIWVFLFLTLGSGIVRALQVLR